jgi:hypothetical protein
MFRGSRSIEPESIGAPFEVTEGEPFELEEKLRADLSEDRRLEMDRYGRTAVYDQIANYLEGDVGEAFSLVNHALTIVDDDTDRKGNIERLHNARLILNMGFRGESVDLSEEREKNVFNLGETLSKLHQSGFGGAEKVFNEVIHYWEIEIQNLTRSGKILSANELDDLNLQIGRSVGLQFMYLLAPQLDERSRECIASSYGLAIKLADNLSDLAEDLKQGSINISQEDIERYNLNISDLSAGDSQLYRRAAFDRARQYYAQSDELLEDVISRCPSCREALLMFKEIAHSWLRQAGEICMIADLKGFDIAGHPQPEPLSTEEILGLEEFYGARLSDIILRSYGQEAENTRRVRQSSDPTYNPYSHEKMPQANQVIRELINNLPGIVDVLDLGCYDGARTVDMYEGKTLHGVELVRAAGEEAVKRDIRTYQGSMINELYKDQQHPDGREFDLVSIVGEMANFVGTETDALLSNALRQVKDNRYLLISCVHSGLDRDYDGKYIIWSFKDPADKKWELEEEKIPRAFRILSRQSLLRILAASAETQHCDLTLIGERAIAIEKYFEDASVAIYVFRKNSKS